MNVITVSHEYGAGASAVARSLAETLGWELLDRELLHQAAAVEHVPDADFERLDEHEIGLLDRFRLHPPHERYLHGLTEAVRLAAERGRVVLVGRGTRQLVGDRPNALHIRVVAPRSWRAERMARQEGWPADEAVTRCMAIDRTRDRFTRYFFGSAASVPAEYDLVANTGLVPLEDVVATALVLVRGGAGEPASSGSGRAVLTLTHERGACDMHFVPTLAERLGLHLYDRELLERGAAQLHVTVAKLAATDERPSGIFRRLLVGDLPERYLDSLRRLMGELAARGGVLLFGRGGSHFLKGDPAAFHVRLVASTRTRLRQVMGERWVRESVARTMIATSDRDRQQYYASYLNADWSDPLEYHLTINSGRLGDKAQDVIAVAARRYWSRLPPEQGGPSPGS
jgi:cytidylate kinase